MAPRKALLLFLALAACLGMPAPTAAADTKGDEADAEEAPTPAGVLVGRFYLRDVRGAEGAQLRLSLALYAAVHEDHAASFRKLLAARNARVRSEVLTALWLTELSDLEQPGLQRLRRRIQVRLRRVLPELAIERLLIGEFQAFLDRR